MFERKNLPFSLVEVKEVSGGWEFSGYASTFGNIDLGGDIVMPGAFDASLSEGQHKPLLMSHNDGIVIGGSKSFTVDEHGLLGVWDLVDTTHGTDVYKLLKRGHLKAMSIGYVPRKYSFDNDGNRLLEDVDLLEVSTVPVPMNPEAVVTNVKGYGLTLDEHITQLRDAAESISSRLTAGMAKRVSEGQPVKAARLDLLVSSSGTLRDLADQMAALATPPAPPERLNVGMELRRRRLVRAGVLLESAS